MNEQDLTKNAKNVGDLVLQALMGDIINYLDSEESRKSVCSNSKINALLPEIIVKAGYEIMLVKFKQIFANFHEILALLERKEKDLCQN